MGSVHALDDPSDRASWAAYHAEIDRRLNDVRPQRAGVSETNWRQPVYGWARNHIPNEQNLVRHFAEQEVNKREREATKQGNKILRDYLHGRTPLSWGMLGPLPIKVGSLRIRFDAATPDDVEDAARELEKNAKQTYDEVVLLAGGMRDLARDARRSGHSAVAQLGDLPQRNGEDEEPEDWDSPFSSEED